MDWPNYFHRVCEHERHFGYVSKYCIKSLEYVTDFKVACIFIIYFAMVKYVHQEFFTIAFYDIMYEFKELLKRLGRRKHIAAGSNEFAKSDNLGSFANVRCSVVVLSYWR